MSSRDKRRQIVDLLSDNVLNNPDSYPMYITFCVVGWYFRDIPGGLSTVDQVKVFNYVHSYVAVLNHEFDTPELNKAHDIMHELGLELVDKLKAKGIISADDEGLEGDDELLSKHRPDFDKWTDELKDINLNEEEK